MWPCYSRHQVKFLINPMITIEQARTYYKALLASFRPCKPCKPLSHPSHVNILKASWVDTCLGPMVAIADDDALYLLEFVDSRGLEREVLRLKKRLHAAIIPENSAPIQSIEAELLSYFAGNLKEFKTPFHLLGSDFQKQAWHALRQIPYGETRSYREQAEAIGNPTAFRAVANANGANQLAIMIPCHRIITSQGTLGGYGGGIARKQWLIEHEKKNKSEGFLDE